MNELNQKHRNVNQQSCSYPVFVKCEFFQQSCYLCSRGLALLLQNASFSNLALSYKQRYDRYFSVINSKSITSTTQTFEYIRFTWTELACTKRVLKMQTQDLITLYGAKMGYNTLNKRRVLFSSPFQTALACIQSRPHTSMAVIRSIFSPASLSPGEPYIVKDSNRQKTQQFVKM